MSPFALAVVVVFSLMATTALALSTDTQVFDTYKVTGDCVNFRSGPYVTAPSYGFMYKGGVVLALQEL